MVNLLIGLLAAYFSQPVYYLCSSELGIFTKPRIFGSLLFVCLYLFQHLSALILYAT